MTPPRLRLGTRASALARWQANWVAQQLAQHGAQVELVLVTTRGDADPQERIADIGSPGAFTKELQRALLNGHIDLAVHSLKDLPTDPVEGLVLAAVPERASVFDVLVSPHGNLAGLPAGATVGTGSLRRRAQLLHARPDLQMCDVRGNVDTRLTKLAAGQYNALVLAQAGLARLGLEDHIAQVLPPEVMLPAVGQGALAVETRADDSATRAAVAPLDDAASHVAVVAERALLAALEGGCLAPIGAWARPQSDGQLRLDAVVLSADGARRLAAHDSVAVGEPAAAIALGESVARRLLAAGAGEVLRQVRGGS
ncbi:MAG: hydroxymethylbilane synthase [Pirellulales bacterium]